MHKGNKATRTSKTKKTANARLQQISRVAANLFFEKGYMQTTTKEIAEACNISVGTLYYYIKSKDDFPIIFGAIHKHDINRWEKKIRDEMQDSPPEETLKKAIRLYAYEVDKRRKMVLFWYNVSRYLNREQLEDMVDVETRIVTLFKEIVELCRGKDHASFSDPFVTGYNIMMLCHTWALKRWWLKRTYTIEQYAKMCEELAVAMARGNAT